MTDIAKYRHVGGVEDSIGNVVGMPIELNHALMIDGLARRYGVLPSAVLNEDASIIQMIEMVEEFRRGE